MSHPHRGRSAVHHPSYIDFFEQVLRTTDPIEIEKPTKSFAKDVVPPPLPDGYAYHGVHPFYM